MRKIKDVQVKYFYRHPSPKYHSIENVFDLVSENLPKDIIPEKYTMKTPSKGLFNRIVSLFEAFLNRGDINHITGDISYLTLILSGKTTIVTFHDLESIERKSKVKTWLLKFFWIKLPARKAAVITTISEHTKNKLIEWTGVKSNKVKVIYNPLSPSFRFSPSEFNVKKPVILVAGTKSNKNLEGIVKAVKGLSCSLIILGKLSKIQQKTLDINGIEYRNMFNVSYDKVIDLYKSCDLLCFPSFYEGFGLPIIEAQAIGRPVITSNYGAMKEIAGDAAMFVDPNKTDQISDAINTLTNDREIRDNLIHKGLKNIRRFEAVEIARQYAELYKDCMRAD
jgi:glycosyltransferase involved in cell wall biosynthesis